MSKDKLIGLDLGTVTCGVALSDELKWFAHPLKTIRFSENDVESLLPELKDILRDNNVTEIILGYPKMLNGDIGVRAQASEAFKLLLEDEFALPVKLIDERFTTAAANRSLISANVSRKKRKQVVDQLAAVNILQSYLDSLKR